MTALEPQPLYVRARDSMIDRLINGQWKPGQMLPSEFAIAKEMGVSQGTVRKALDELTAKGLLLRKQGRGTFVSEAEDQSILFRFYRLTSNNDEGNLGSKVFPQSTNLSRTRGQATQQEQDIFDIDATGVVWRFERLRSDDEQPILWEKLVLPSARFTDFTENTLLPNNVYQFYSAKYGIIVARVKEQLRAVAAPSDVANMLHLPVGEPLLEVDRRAIALDGKIVEWRVSLCRSDTMHYRNELT